MTRVWGRCSPQTWMLLGVVAVLTIIASVAAPRVGGTDVAGGSTDVAFNVYTTPWSGPMPIVTGLPNAAKPALTFTRDRIAHAVWESAGTLYYASRSADGRWGVVERVATGTSPALVADSTGILHVVFANQFMGNHEIYHVYRKDGSWSLPVNVSHTTGFSAEPTLVITADDTLHAAWMDNTPGYWTIYFGTWHEEVWSSEPVPNGRGQIPALTAGRNGALYLAWQDRIPTAGVLDIFLSEFVGGNWSLPVNISNRPTVDSIGASLTTANDGFVHLTWIDAGNEVRYSYGRGNGWSLPQTISSASAVANAPHILAEDDGWLDIAWDEGEIIRATGRPVGTSSWSKPEVITVPIANLKDVTMAAIPVGGVTLGWAQLSSGNAGIYTAWRESAFSWHLWLPVALH